MGWRYGLSFIAFCLPAGVVQAGGLISYEIGTPDLGLASAGYAARAQDAATAMTNPAGMTRLSCTELMLGIQPLYGDVEFSSAVGTTVSGGNGGNAVGWFPGGSAFFVYDWQRDFKVGLSVYGNFGLPLHYDGNWVGRYYVTKATLLGMTLSPSIAYRIHKMWSLGASFNAMYGILSQTAAVNNSPAGLFGPAPDGELHFRDTTWGYGLTFGFLFEPTDSTRFGLTYTTEMDLNFKNTIQLNDVFPIIIPSGNFSTPLDLGMTVPQQVMLSIYHGWGKSLAILGNVGWQNWEQFGKVGLTVGSAQPLSLIEHLDYRNTWHVAGGMQWDVTQAWCVSLGTAYDSDMIASGRRSVSLPIGSAWRVGAGIQYFMCDDINAGIGYTRLMGGNLGVDEFRGILAGRVVGEYDNTVVNYIGLNINWVYN